MDFTTGLNEAMESLHRSGAFLTVSDNNNTNTMTISWGSIGFMWGKPVFTVLVRPSRYTFEFIEKAKDFTVSIPKYGNMKDALKICGTQSGRDIDKCEVAGIEFLKSKEVLSPVVDQCEYYYECKILYKHEMIPTEIEDSSVEGCYKGENYHVMYYGEIVKVYNK